MDNILFGNVMVSRNSIGNLLGIRHKVFHFLIKKLKGWPLKNCNGAEKFIGGINRLVLNVLIVISDLDSPSGLTRKIE